jgi:alpha-galactosidase
MAAPTELPEFKGNVAAVWTDQYWDKELGELDKRLGLLKKKVRELTHGKELERDERIEIERKTKAEMFTAEDIETLKGRSNQEYHYLGSAKIYGQIGKGFAEAMLELEK